MVAVAVAAAAVTGALLGMTLATAAQGDQAAKTGAQLGLEAEEVQELGFAVEQTGGSVADLTTALRTQARTAAEAVEGTGAAADAYRILGVRADDATGAQKKQVPLLLELADAFKKQTNDGAAAALAQDIFGRSGTRLLPFLRQGAEGINALRQQARDLGFVMSNDAAKGAEDLTDRLNEARKIVVGLRNQIGVALMPVLTSMIEGFRDWFIANRKVIDQRIDRVMGSITNAAEFLQTTLQRINRFVEDRVGGWEVIFQQVEKAVVVLGGSVGFVLLIKNLRAVTVLIRGIGVAAVANPAGILFVAIAAAVILAALALDDFITFLRGGDSVFGSFLDRFERSEAFLEQWNNLMRAGEGFGLAFMAAIRGIGEALGITIPEFESWEDVFKALDAAGLIFILNMESGLKSVADEIDRATKALASLKEALGFGLELAGEFVESQNDPFALTSVARLGAGATGGALIQSAVETFFAKASQSLGPATASAASAQTIGGARSFSTSFGDTTNNFGAVTNPQEIAGILERLDKARRLQTIADAAGGNR